MVAARGAHYKERGLNRLEDAPQLTRSAEIEGARRAKITAPLCDKAACWQFSLVSVSNNGI